MVRVAGTQPAQTRIVGLPWLERTTITNTWNHQWNDDFALADYVASALRQAQRPLGSTRPLGSDRRPHPRQRRAPSRTERHNLVASVWRPPPPPYNHPARGPPGPDLGPTLANHGAPPPPKETHVRNRRGVGGGELGLRAPGGKEGAVAPCPMWYELGTRALHYQNTNSGIARRPLSRLWGLPPLPNRHRRSHPIGANHRVLSRIRGPGRGGGLGQPATLGLHMGCAPRARLGC